MSKNHFVSHFLPFQINTTIFHFWSHFWPFQINTQLFLIFFTKWLLSAILDVRSSFWITFLAILDQYRFFIFWMSENHFRSHFYPFHIDTQLFFWNFWQNGRWRTFWMCAGVHFGCPQITFDRISGQFRSICNFNFFLIFLTKWPPATILYGTTMSIIELVRDIWMSNACVKFE